MTVLIIGLGSIAKKHVKVLRKLRPEAAIYALRSSTCQEDEGVINISALSLLPGQPDFVIISNPTACHGKTIWDCLHLGAPLFIEKPVLDNLNDATKLAVEIDRREITTYVGCNMRFHPGLQYVKEYLRVNEPRINEVNIYCGSYLPSWRPGTDFRTSYSVDPARGGGVHLDLIHEMDYCTWLFGMPQKVVLLKTQVSSLQIEATDFAVYHAMYPGFCASITLNYFRRDAKREVEIVCENDTLVLDLLENTVVSKMSGEIIYKAAFRIMDTYEEQIDYFIKQVEMGLKPENDFKNGVEVLKLALHE